MGLLDSLLGTKKSKIPTTVAPTQVASAAPFQTSAKASNLGSIDANALNAQQQAANLGVAQQTQGINAINTSNDFGALNFGRDAQGNVISQSQNLTGQAAQFSQGGLSLANQRLGQINQGAFDPNALPSTQNVAQNIFDQQKALLQPGFDRANQQLAISLENRGLPVEQSGEGARAFAQHPQFEAQNLALQNAAFQANDAARQQFQTNRSNALQDRALPGQEAAQAAQLGFGPAQFAPGASVLPGVNVQGTNLLGAQTAQADLQNASVAFQENQDRARNQIIGQNNASIANAQNANSLANATAQNQNSLDTATAKNADSQRQTAALSSLLGSAAGIAFAPLTGGTSLAGLAGSLGSFGGSGGGPQFTTSSQGPGAPSFLT